MELRQSREVGGLVLDLVDKRILVELFGNCRLSYQKLARHFGLTVNAIRKRVDKLQKLGVIHKFEVGLNGWYIARGRAPNLVLVQFSTDGTENEEAFVEQLGKNPRVAIIYKTTQRTYGIEKWVPDLQELSELVEFLRGFVVVRDVDTFVCHGMASPGWQPALSTPKACSAFTFNDVHLRVIRCLLDDPRMTIADIVQRTRLTPRRVRMVINTFLETRIVLFTILADFSAGGLVNAYLRASLDLRATSREDYVKWLYDQYPFELWSAFYLAEKPEVVFCLLAAHNLEDIQEIARMVKQASFCKASEVLVTYRQQQWNYTMRRALEDLLAKARR